MEDMIVWSVEPHPHKVRCDLPTRLRVWMNQILPGRLQAVIGCNFAPPFVARMVDQTHVDSLTLQRQGWEDFGEGGDFEAYEEFMTRLYEVKNEYIDKMTRRI